MAGGTLTFLEWANLSEYERGERYKDLSDADKFRVRISMNPGAKSVRCNSCRHYHGFAKCAAFPNGIPKTHITAVDENPSIECGHGVNYEQKTKNYTG